MPSSGGAGFEDANISTNFTVEVAGIDKGQMNDFTVREVILAESLLTPGLQTSIFVDSYVDSIDPIKNFDQFKGKTVAINIDRPILLKHGYKSDLQVSQVLYRLGGRSSKTGSTDNRHLSSRGIEKLTFHACDQTLLNDAGSLVSKAWKCTTPDKVVRDVLGQCAGAPRMNIESASPARDYIAENIHPFQVVTQQANAALAGGNDPSFVHFMTYENYGTHHFRSLKTMCQQAGCTKTPLRYSSTGQSYAEKDTIMHYEFPCDFDLLSDILNGVGTTGADINSLVLFNPAAKLFSLLGNQTVGCGIGGGVLKIAMSNRNTAAQQNECPDYVDTYLLRRQARMMLLERDKVALRLTVPWNPVFNAGKVLQIEIPNAESKGEEMNYGTGSYLITAVVHNLKQGGYSTITMDCVSTTAGSGVV